MITIFDDGTSFAHNIAQLIGMSGATPIVVEAADADLAVLSQASGIVVAARVAFARSVGAPCPGYVRRADARHRSRLLLVR